MPPFLVVPPPLAATALPVDPPLVPVPVACASGLERKESVEPLVAVAPFPPHRPWAFFPVLHPLMAALLALQEAQKRLVEESVYLLHPVRRPLDVPALPPLLRVLLRLLQLPLQ